LKVGWLENRQFAMPFLKWAGGKRWLARRIASLIEPGRRLVEPFVGGGAVFFMSAPDKALLADINPDLVATLRAVRNHPRRVIKTLLELRINSRTFHCIRRTRPIDDVDRAVRLIYLNRTAFNGLYRVNRRGEFNVPFGCKPGTRLCDAGGINEASDLLAKAEVQRQDFRITLAEVEPEDIVYVDPPYTVKHDNNGFRRYNEKIFSWDDQRELAGMLCKLARKGVRVIVSNAHHDTVKSMYPISIFHSLLMTRATCMAGDATRRGKCTEWLLVSKSFEKSERELRAMF
jgi:DNA adenine methylase